MMTAVVVVPVPTAVVVVPVTTAVAPPPISDLGCGGGDLGKDVVVEVVAGMWWWRLVEEEVFHDEVPRRHGIMSVW
ncbi:hypothetical protein HanPI659440_Chr09g0333931 [Helianthus annuus]|nr:hypothetical protein HanPI659440_Chr09g0333931 [Helianthus annuus]